MEQCLCICVILNLIVETRTTSTPPAPMGRPTKERKIEKELMQEEWLAKKQKLHIYRLQTSKISQHFHIRWGRVGVGDGYKEVKSLIFPLIVAQWEAKSTHYILVRK